MITLVGETESSYSLSLELKGSDAPTRPASESSLSRKMSKSGENLAAKTSSVKGSRASLDKEKDEDKDSQISDEDGTPTEPEINEVDIVFVRYPDDCCPACCMKKVTCCETCTQTKCGQMFWTMRCYTFKLVEHNYFETFIIVMILMSSLALVS